MDLIRKKCLIISSRYPYSYYGGDSLRTINLISYMQSLNYEVDLLTFIDGRKPNIVNPQKLKNIFIIENNNKFKRYISILKSLINLKPIQCGYYINLKSIPQIKKINYKKYDVIIIFLSRLCPILKYINSDARIILDMADILTLNYSNAWNAEGLEFKWKLIYTLELPLIRNYERSLLKTNFPKLFVSQRDINFAIKELNGNEESIHNLSNHVEDFSVEKIKSIVKSKNKHRKKNSTFKICFIGNMQAQHNKSAIIQLINKEFFKILNSINCEIFIVGRMSNKQVVYYRAKGFNVIQNPENILEACKHFDCGISVLKHCSGLQNKLYDYTLLGLPIISSFDSAEGIGFKKNIHYIEAENNDQIIIGIKRLIKNPNFGIKLTSNCLNYIYKNFSKSKTINKLESILF